MFLPQRKYVNNILIQINKKMVRIWWHFVKERTFGPAAAVAKALLFSSDSCSFCGWFVHAYNESKTSYKVTFDTASMRIHLRTTVNKKKQDS